MSPKPVHERKCVICGKPQEEKYKPFCSKRCADVDLNRWFSGGYAIPAVEEDEPDDETPEPS
ncbi:MAG TPA: DNA gyrase inhibitor YacG [Vitreimonas sp.]|uniref:DNA gyrase inhibitor YacG n=1 Tax=Vitreimonas sp. TaxID=3069702 RepID=UPI002D45AFB0|nr:DNA gyrase inhibitor YacG [Vitreimonas sp.]HYD86840.1 DNA gyrase inhibitor YacG [Vitreimonas sp.]